MASFSRQRFSRKFCLQLMACGHILPVCGPVCLHVAHVACMWAHSACPDPSTARRLTLQRTQNEHRNQRTTRRIATRGDKRQHPKCSNSNAFDAIKSDEAKKSVPKSANNEARPKRKHFYAKAMCILARAFAFLTSGPSILAGAF